MKNCRVCKTELNDTNWFASLQKKNCVICKKCNNNRMQLWREENRDRANELSRINAKTNRKRFNEVQRRHKQKLRAEVVNKLGGKCKHCGIDNIDVLDIDHVNDDGNIHRKNGISGRSLCQLIKREGFPKHKYQVLCRNCNWLKALKILKNNIA